MKQTSTNFGLPLEGVRVLDFSQYLAGPACAMRLADMGAEVIKVERPKSGDLCRKLAVADQWVGEDSLLFQTINRGKKSVAADLKNPSDLEAVRQLITTADVMIHNFRPGVMERIGLGFAEVSALNSKLICGVVSGYGTKGPWRDLPGQDLLAQARSGMVWLSGSADDAPIPFGVSITDIAAGMNLAQGILAALFKQARTGQGTLVEVSLLASAMDLQFEQFTSYMNTQDKALPQRSAISGANVHGTAPYGIYKTLDGHLAIAMAPIQQLRDLLSIEALTPFVSPDLAFAQRDQIKTVLRDHLMLKPTSYWLERLEPAGVWCAEILDWKTLEQSGALDALKVVQEVTNADGSSFKTTSCPIRFNEAVLSNGQGAPELGANTQEYLSQNISRDIGVA